ncbi:MAG: lipopolysaccharide biosynthesis protein [Acidimicrobiales bacterium]
MTPDFKEYRVRMISALKTSLFKNSGFIMAATMVSGGLGFIYWTIIARVSNPREVGIATAIVAAFTLTSLLASFGIAQLMIQVLPSIHDDESWSAFVTVSLVTVTVFAACVGAAAGLLLPHLSPTLAELRHPEMFTLFVIGASASTTAIGLDAVYVASRRSGKMLQRNLVFGLLKGLLLIAAVPLLVLVDSTAIITSWDAGLIISLVLGTWYLIPRVRPGAHFTFRGGVWSVLRWWRSMAGHQFANIGSILVPYVLPILVIIRTSARDNAYFYLTWSVGAIFFMVSPAISAALFAEGSHGESIADNVKRSARLIMFILGPAIFITCLFSYRILQIFGTEYAKHASTLLILLAFAAIPDAITNIAISVLRIQNKLSSAALLNLFMAGVAVGLSWFLLPHFGILAPGIGWTVGQSAGTVAVGATSLWRRFCHTRKSRMSS